MTAPLRILFGTSVLARGHGVSLVIKELVQRLRVLLPNAEIAIAALRIGEEERTSMHEVGITVLPCTADFAEHRVSAWKPDVFLPHTDPFFGMVPKSARIVVHEHGDPSPALFALDRDERDRQRHRKQVDVYHHADVVLAISEFQRQDLPWPSAQLLYNGCNHVPDLGAKSWSDLARTDPPSFRLGVLSRLDGGEALYKGFEILQILAPRLKEKILGLELEYCGKISPSMISVLEAEGWRVRSGVTDQQRNDWLRSCHLILSPSLWEGFNLPLVEAQALGSMAVAFDTGAHPEVVPFVCGGIDEMEGLIVALDQNRELLCQYSQDAYKFVRDRFNWDHSAEALAQLILKLTSRRRSI